MTWVFHKGCRSQKPILGVDGIIPIIGLEGEGPKRPGHRVLLAQLGWTARDPEQASGFHLGLESAESDSYMNEIIILIIVYSGLND